MIDCDLSRWNPTLAPHLRVGLSVNLDPSEWPKDSGPVPARQRPCCLREPRYRPYSRRISEASPAAGCIGGSVLVSCIMPTCNRQGYIPVALKCYLSQDWPDTELVV